ncbi:hypothetical protein BDP27DRAFT_1368544 [Rhodocollybia butyracea]|uniref:Uncharacterized protein n=1 Tax=Rhodocollybia butyracea TaxID=206335 RepID=A0A9P5PHB9_9AGAR|nr:hypothetical protein BDP27DRAFT_1369135 [Rhodocollybia butyracea]KAF9062834.1 hypothetical protein BDP27DRAFT_1368544 [Rhodocollybia butyracea]
MKTLKPRYFLNSVEISQTTIGSILLAKLLDAGADETAYATVQLFVVVIVESAHVMQSCDSVETTCLLKLVITNMKLPILSGNFHSEASFIVQYNRRKKLVKAEPIFKDMLEVLKAEFNLPEGCIPFLIISSLRGYEEEGEIELTERAYNSSSIRNEVDKLILKLDREGNDEDAVASPGLQGSSRPSKCKLKLTGSEGAMNNQSRAGEAPNQRSLAQRERRYRERLAKEKLAEEKLAEEELAEEELAEEELKEDSVVDQ